MIASLKNYLILMRFHKPIGIFLLLWPTLWALYLAAHGTPDPHILIVFVLGVILMRAAGCIMNDFADRHIDGHVQRTRERPLVTGVISFRAALGVFAVLCALAFWLVLSLNSFTIELAFIALGLAVLYPFMKRYTYWPQFFLGLAFAWGIPMAYAAQTNQIDLSAWLLFTITVIWTLIYDTQYAMVDRDDDIKIGVKSTAILFGTKVTAVITCLQLGMLSLLVWLGYRVQMQWIYFFGIAITATLFLYQVYLMQQKNRQQWLRAFQHNHWVGLMIWLSICSGFLN